jgi:hypothetical protein
MEHFKLDMEYNSSLPPLIIPEYGRNVQKMVQHLLTIEDREKRNQQAQNLIDIIGNLNPQIRDVPDFKHKLWDHLYIMSEFKLDVDGPYPKPSPEAFQEKPQPVEYPVSSATYRHYGNITRKMVEYTADLEASEEKEALKTAIANHMKKTFLLWNKDNVEDQVILKDMNRLAKGKLKVDEISLSDKSDLIGALPPKKKFTKKRKKRYKPKK